MRSRDVHSNVALPDYGRQGQRRLVGFVRTSEIRLCRAAVAPFAPIASAFEVQSFVSRALPLGRIG